MRTAALGHGDPPDPEALQNFSVTIIGAGMGGLNAALMLGRAGIPYTVVEKNDGVGGTFMPYIFNGVWRNCWCGCNGALGCCGCRVAGSAPCNRSKATT